MSPPQKVDFHISSRRSLSFFLSHPTGACSQTLGPPRGSLCLFCILPSCFFASSVQISPFGTFWKRMGDDGRWKKFQKSQKKEMQRRHRRPRSKQQIRSSSIPFVTFQILEEDVSVSKTLSRSQIADRRSQIGTRACIDEDTFRVTKNSSPTTQCLHKRKAFPHHRFPPMRGTFEVTVKK